MSNPNDLGDNEEMFGIDNEFGGKDYFDSHGNKIGYSMTGIAGQQE